MLEHPPIANAQEKSESLKPDFLAEVQSANADYPYWDKVKYIRTESGLSGKQLWHALKYLRQLNRDRRSTRLNSSHANESRMPSSA